jgi:hypothetical protein
MTRQFLVTKFACSQCGNGLFLSYGGEKPAWRGHAPGQPTGAEMVEDTISIDPCETCTKPARDVADAIKALLRIGGPAT